MRILLAGATDGGHVVRWHPFTPVAGPPGSIAPDWPTVIPKWGPEQRRPGGGLPEPVAALLAWPTSRYLRATARAASPLPPRGAEYADPLHE